MSILNEELRENKDISLTKEEVVETLEVLDKFFEYVDKQRENSSFDFEKFANSYNLGAFTPWAQNELMKSLNISIGVPNKDKIDEALKNPAGNEERLIEYNQSYYFSSLMYKRNQEYLATLPSFDLEMTCINVENDKDYNSPAYKKDYKAIASFLDKFDYRQEFKDVLWNLLMTETYFCMYREFDTKSLLQVWPWKYAKITGKFEYGLLYDIDMRYFVQPQVDINMYPDWCKKTYLEIFRDGKQKDYIPSNTLNRRTGHFATWTQTDPEEGFWCFKFNPHHNLQVPFFSAMLPEMAVVPTMRNLQINQSIAAARKLLVSSIPYLTEKKSGSVVDQIAIDPEILGKFMGLATRGLEEVIKVLALPTEDIKGVEFTNTDQDTYKNFMSVTSSLLSGGKVIFAPNERMNAIQTQVSLNLDELLVESIYPQFADFLNFYANKKTKKYKWRFKFVGSNDKFDRERRQKEVFTYADKGVVLPNKIASSLGLNKIELERELAEAKASKFTDKLLLMINVNTMGQNGGDGRPVKSDSDLTDSGSETRTQGSNIEKGGNV